MPDDIWSSTGSLNTARASFQLIKLTSGKVLAIGGCTAYASPLASCELYDPNTEVWTYTGSLNTARCRFAAILLDNGKVLVMGGSTPSNTDTCELYDPTAETWSYTGTLGIVRMGANAFKLDNGNVLFHSGYSNAGESEIYDVTSGTWSATGSIPFPDHRNGSNLVRIPTGPNAGKLFLAGGSDFDAVSNVNKSTLLYDQSSGVWSISTDMTQCRADEQDTGTDELSVVLNTGNILIGGSYMVVNPGNTVTYDLTTDLYDPITGISIATTGSLSKQHIGGRRIKLTSGNVIIIGGCDTTFFGQTVTEKYNPGSDMWSTVGALSQARHSFCSVLLDNGKVLAAGGFSSGFSSPLATSELYTEFAIPPVTYNLIISDTLDLGEGFTRVYISPIIYTLYVNETIILGEWLTTNQDHTGIWGNS